MRIAHLSVTPCAGAISALSSAIRDFTEHGSRWICTSGSVNNLRFEEDVLWQDTAQCGILARCDFMVFHNGSSPRVFAPPIEPMRDYLLGDPSKRIAYFHHSHPDACAGLAAESEGLRCFVPAQYQATLWKDCVPVRGVVRFDRSDFPKRKDRGDGKVRIGYAPTFRESQNGREPGSAAWYHCKGFDVTVPVLAKLAQARKDVEFTLIEGLPYDMAMEVKSSCDILIDEVVTGSYHRSTLEALALGIPAVVNISPEVHGVMVRAAGANDIPVVHATAETLEERLLWLIGMKKDARRELGASGRDWMVRHWHPQDIARRFCADLAEVGTEARGLSAHRG